MSIDVSVEHTVYNFKAEEYAKQANGKTPAACFLLNPEDGSGTFALKRQNFYRSTQRHTPKYDTLHSHRSENLKSNFYHTQSQNIILFTN